MFRVIAFYTKNTPYEDEVEELVESAKSVGLTNIEVIPYSNTGRWVTNAALKSVFVSSMLAKYPKEDMLYVDVDARFRKYPKLFDNFECDIGVHYRRGRELLSGTIYFKNNEKVRRLVKNWIAYQSQYPLTWDQKTLQKVLEADADIKVDQLPASYTQIFDSMAHHGEPVIEHMQASRRYKKLVGGLRSDPIPDTIGKSRIRRGYDGIYYIVRRDPVAEAYLDEHCTRMENQLKWYPFVQSEEQISNLSPLFKDEICYIVGKGPSLDRLQKSDFEHHTAPVIAINEAIHAVEKLDLLNPTFCIQQDAKIRDTCYPRRGRLLVSVKAANWYANRDRVYIYDPRRYRLNLNCLSVSVAIKIAQSLGAIQFTLMCFDASVNGKLTYAKAIGYDAKWGGSLDRFLSHREKIERHLARTPATWVIPGESL